MKFLLSDQITYDHKRRGIRSHCEAWIVQHLTDSDKLLKIKIREYLRNFDKFCMMSSILLKALFSIALPFSMVQLSLAVKIIGHKGACNVTTDQGRIDLTPLGNTNGTARSVNLYLHHNYFSGYFLMYNLMMSAYHKSYPEF